jgi:site-specific recombinase XerD
VPLSLELPEVRDFLAYLALNNFAPNTITRYRSALQDLFSHGPRELAGLQEITPTHLREHVADLQTRGYAAKTLYARVQTLKRFFAYLVIEGQLKTDPARRLPLPKVGKRLPKALSLAEMEALLHAIRKDPQLVLRDRVLIELLYLGGLRIREALHLRVEDCDLSDDSVRVIGKGDIERRVYLKPPVLKRLCDYIEKEELTGLLFPGRGDKSLSEETVRKRLKGYARAAGITRPVTPHVLRHSIAVHYLQGGAPINFVQSLLGHAKLSTTGQYLLLSDEMTKRIALDTQTAVDRLNEETKRGVPKLREARASFDIDDLAMLDAYVSDVLLWLAEG